MKSLAHFIVNHKKLILLVYGVLMILSFIGMRFVSIEYDLSSYLPKEMNAIQGKDILQEEFDMNGSAKLVIQSGDLRPVAELKKKIKSIPGVAAVMWLDDIEDILKQESFMDQKLVERFRKADYNLLQIQFTEGNDSKATQQALNEINGIVKEKHYVGGPAAISKNMQDTMGRELVLYSIVGFAIIFIILFLSSSSYFEPFLFFIVLGVAILLNMGSNFIFGRISSNTHSVASILQLAVSMDYSIFLLHRFHEEMNGKDEKEAMAEAIMKTFGSISSSALTTVCGFLALVAMRYGMGKDMGLVLAKGVFLSLLCVITLLPVLALVTEDRFNKYKHRIFLPSFDRSAGLMVKMRHVILILCLLITLPAFWGQSKLGYYYSTEKTLSPSSEAIIANRKINEIFGENSELVLIFPKGDRMKQQELAVELEKLNGLSSVDSLYSAVDPTLPEFLIPQGFRDTFESEKYTYLILNLRSGVEGKDTKDTIAAIHKAAKNYYEEHYLTGEAAVYLNLEEITSRDFTRVSVISVLLIALILLITFRSIILPLILVFVIELGIWINLSIPYFEGLELNFISFIIIGAIQLGATVDYAILFTSRYKENLIELRPTEAMVQTIKDTGRSVMTSALILMAGTFSVSFITTIRSASELTLLIGRGALISLVLVYMLLPALLLLLSKPIKLTTWGWPEIKK